MNTYILIIFLSCFLDFLLASDFEYFLRSAYPFWEPKPTFSKAAGERLILTSYIEKGNLEEARKRSFVELDDISDTIPSYSGFLTVDERFNSNLFFWYFPAQNNKTDAPLVLWLQGGPGASSLFGMFEEIGPFSVKKESDGNYSLIENMFTWNKNYSLIFIDNPVGTGYSFTDHQDGYARNQTIVGEHLYKAMIQIFTIYTELKDVPFFITGESYAGKYIPTLAYTIDKYNPTADLWINLEGIAVGNGFTDPKSMLDYSKYTFQLGLIDEQTRDTMELLESWSREAIRVGNTTDAYISWYSILEHFAVKSYYTNFYNYLNHKGSNIGPYYNFVQSLNVRRALHVGDAEFTSIGKVYRMMLPDFMNSVQPWLEKVINKYRVLFYSGQMDIIVAYPLSVNMFKNLKYNMSTKYANAPRKPWYVDDELAGYMKSAGHFTEVLVRNAGHMVPTDQPRWALDLITRFINNNLVQ